MTVVVVEAALKHPILPHSSSLRGDQPLPCELGPWQSARWWVNYEGFRETLRRNGHRGKLRVKLEAMDASGRSHFARTQIILNAPWWRRLLGG